MLSRALLSEKQWQGLLYVKDRAFRKVGPEVSECCVQSCSPAQGLTTPASEGSQGSPHRRLHSPAMPFLDVSSDCSSS